MLKSQSIRVKASIAEVLRVRSFLFLWLSQIFSQIAFNMLNFVLVLRAYQLTRANTASAALVLTFMVPQLVLSLFAGVLVDRLEKKFVMLITNAIRAVCLVPLIFLDSSLLVLYVSAFFISTVTQFFLPAEIPMIPRLVKRRLLLPANALFTGTLYGSIIIGALLAGPSLKYLGVTATFIAIALLFVVASLCNSLLPGITSKNYFKTQFQRFAALGYGGVLRVLFNDIGEVLFIILRSKRLFFAITFLTISQIIIVVLGALLPGYATSILAIDVEDSSLVLMAPAAFGMVISSLVVSHIGHYVRKSLLILPGIMLSGIALLLLPIFSRVHTSDINLLYPVIATCFFLGIFNAMVIIPSNIIIQERSVEAIRGRIYGMFNAISALCALVPVAIAGYFSDIFGVGRVLTILGVATIVVGLIPLLSRKESI